VRGKWATGIEPRDFTWVFRGVLAVSERPGGSTLVHRQVRRNEELIWLRAHGVNRIVSILPEVATTPVGDHALTVAHYPLTDLAQADVLFAALFADLQSSAERGDVVLLHSDDVSDRLLGLIAAYISWSGKVESETLAIHAVERLFQRAIGPEGREMVRLTPRS
jgi:hypothetical protein